MQGGVRRWGASDAEPVAHEQAQEVQAELESARGHAGHAGSVYDPEP